MIVLTWISVGFQQRDRKHSQALNKYTFCRLFVTSAQILTGTGNNPDAKTMTNYVIDDYSQGYGQRKETFGAVTKDDILETYRSHHDFRSSSVSVDDIDYDLYVFDIRCQENFTALQPNKVEFKFDAVVPNDINGYALVLTNQLVTVSSDGQKHFHLIQSRAFHNIFLSFQCYLCLSQQSFIVFLW